MNDFDEQFEDDEFDDDFETGEDSEDGFEEESVEEETQEAAGDYGDDEEFDKPVSEGETVEVEIEDLGSKGDGIARVEGFVVFVPGGEVGESYEVEVTSVGRKFAFAEIVE